MASVSRSQEEITCCEKWTKFLWKSNGPKGVDKTLKVVVCASNVFQKAMEGSTASSGDVMAGVASTTRALKDTRTVIGLFNVFNGVIPRMARSIKSVGDLYHSDTVSPWQKMLGIARDVMNFIGSTFYVIGFALCRPICFVNKHFAGVSESAKAIGSKFSIMMVGLHVGKTLSLIADYIYQNLEDLTSAGEDALRKVNDKIKDIYFQLAEKVCELTNDVVTLFDLGVSPWVSLIANLSAALIGFCRVWHLTA